MQTLAILGGTIGFLVSGIVFAEPPPTITTPKPSDARQDLPDWALTEDRENFRIAILSVRAYPNLANGQPDGYDVSIELSIQRLLDPTQQFWIRRTRITGAADENGAPISADASGHRAPLERLLLPPAGILASPLDPRAQSFGLRLSSLPAIPLALDHFAGEVEVVVIQGRKSFPVNLEQNTPWQPLSGLPEVSTMVRRIESTHGRVSTWVLARTFGDPVPATPTAPIITGIATVNSESLRRPLNVGDAEPYLRLSDGMLFRGRTDTTDNQGRALQCEVSVVTEVGFHTVPFIFKSIPVAGAPPVPASPRASVPTTSLASREPTEPIYRWERQGFFLSLGRFAPEVERSLEPRRTTHKKVASIRGSITDLTESRILVVAPTLNISELLDENRRSLMPLVKTSSSIAERGRNRPSTTAELEAARLGIELECPPDVPLPRIVSSMRGTIEFAVAAGPTDTELPLTGEWVSLGQNSPMRARVQQVDPDIDRNQRFTVEIEDEFAASSRDPGPQPPDMGERRLPRQGIPILDSVRAIENGTTIAVAFPRPTTRRDKAGSNATFTLPKGSAVKLVARTLTTSEPIQIPFDCRNMAVTAPSP